MSAWSSNTMYPPDPSPDPIAAMSSYVSGVSSCDSVITALATPDSTA
jgi:hypothetical protein